DGASRTNVAVALGRREAQRRFRGRPRSRFAPAFAQLRRGRQRSGYRRGGLLFRRASFFSAACRRANSVKGTAGEPMTLVWSGTSSRTALLAATWTRLPIFRWPEKPLWPATAT